MQKRRAASEWAVERARELESSRARELSHPRVRAGEFENRKCDKLSVLDCGKAGHFFSAHLMGLSYANSSEQFLFSRTLTVGLLYRATSEGQGKHERVAQSRLRKSQA
jgi:hypothetical protein